MQSLTSVPYIKKLLSKAGFKFSKGLGQNFLIDPDICPNMARLSGCAGKGVIEIGPGIGVLTAELCKEAKKVVAIEIDKKLEPILKTTLSEFDNLQIIFGDVLKLNLQEIIKEHFAGMDVVVCANLPYYITSPIIMLLLTSKLPIKSITVMVQKQAGERIGADVGTRAGGAITAAVNYYAKVETLFDVGRDSFLPAPKVDSVVIKLTVREDPPVTPKDERLMFRIIRAGFEQRRKTLCNALSAGLATSKEDIKTALLKSGLKETARAEELTLEQFAKLSDALTEEE